MATGGHSFEVLRTAAGQPAAWLACMGPRLRARRHFAGQPAGRLPAPGVETGGAQPPLQSLPLPCLPPTTPATRLPPCSVLLGPLRAASYLWLHGLLAATLGSLWKARCGFWTCIAAGAAVRMLGQFAYLLMSSVMMNENMWALMLSNIYNMLVRAGPCVLGLLTCLRSNCARGRCGAGRGSELPGGSGPRWQAWGWGLFPPCMNAKAKENIMRWKMSPSGRGLRWPQNGMTRCVRPSHGLTHRAHTLELTTPFPASPPLRTKSAPR